MPHRHSLSYFINQLVNLSLLDLLCRGRRLQSCSEIKLPSRRLSTRLITHSPPSHRTTTTRRTLVAMTVGCLDKVQGDCSDSHRIFILEKVTKKPDGHRPSFRPFLPLGWMRCSIRAPPLYLAREGIRQAAARRRRPRRTRAFRTGRAVHSAQHMKYCL